jgi:hypothetical protein
MEARYRVIMVGSSQSEVVLTHSEISRLPWWCNSIVQRLFLNGCVILTSASHAEVIVVRPAEGT